MTRNVQRNWRWFWAVLAAALLAVGTAQGAIINLQAYILYALLNNDGTTPLADGSMVQIIGSSDSVADPMLMSGTNATGFTTSNDTILATITIQSSALGSNGTFFVGDYYFNSDEVKYMYLRFYDTTNSTLTGMVYWGQSPITNAQHDQFGVLEMDFIGGYLATNLNNFVVIPEPGTMNLIFVWVSMVAAMRASMKRDQQKKNPALKGKVKREEPVVTYDRF